MQQRLAYQAKELDSYDATRHYAVKYAGFDVKIAGAMVVQVHYDRASGKRFHILSQSGSKLLCDKVLKKAVDSEEEAAQDKSSTALTPANYSFQLLGTDLLNGRPSYLLHVDPLRPGKFLYRGKVWVDAADFTVAKIEVEPAKNPSMWISHSSILNTYAPTDGIWLPQSNRSDSKIRIGGTAELTIDYGTYHVVLADKPKPAATRLVPARPAGEGSSFLSAKRVVRRAAVPVAARRPPRGEAAAANGLSAGLSMANAVAAPRLLIFRGDGSMFLIAAS